ncbi:unnamed protein product [Mesocestoides corti]|uniref:tRNA (adenine(58)-N(1))-methyltransferase n=1 Tax=Mesocestoides corti TaxID=53468 RepID=A0A3P6HH17_MESCO|nr:unnamed protein product [Mesocestoides corti]
MGCHAFTSCRPPKRPFRKNIAAEGDSVIVAYGKSDTQLIQLVRGAVTQNKFGALKHDEIIGKPYGSRIVVPRGHVCILGLDPVIWTQTLPHRTQIIYPTDSSMIVGQLDLVPGFRVLEAGTGSGALTHALAQAVWPTGRVRTFDFHRERVERASAEFAQHGLEEVVTVKYRDVLTDGFPAIGLEHNPDGCHAIMIDLPEPWGVLPGIALFYLLGGRVCIFSPCIEQVQRSCENLRTAGFTDIEVVECVSRSYDVVHTLFNGTYVHKKSRTANDGNEGTKGAGCDRHLFPPPTKYVTSTTQPCEMSKGHAPGRHQDGSWEAFPRVRNAPLV